MDENLIEVPPVVNPQFSQLQDLGVSFDEEGRLAEDVTCRSCEYNLRGLTLHTYCPECETAIDLTLHPSLVRFSDTAWLKRVRLGITLFIVCIFAWLLIVVISIASSALGPLSSSKTSGAIDIIILIASFVLMWVQIVVFVLITTIEKKKNASRNIAAENNFSSRKIARYCLVASILMSTASMLLDPSTYNTFTGEYFEYDMFEKIFWWVSLLSSILGIVGMFALFDYSRSLALRFPVERMAKHTRLVMWGYMIPVIIFTIWGIVIQIVIKEDLIDFTSRTVMSSIMLINVIVGLPALVFSILGFVLLFKYRSQFTKAMNLAAKQRELLISQINLANSAAAIHLTKPAGR